MALTTYLHIILYDQVVTDANIVAVDVNADPFFTCLPKVPKKSLGGVGYHESAYSR